MDNRSAYKTLPADGLQPPLTPDVEAVEKVNLVRIRRAGRKCNFSGCSVCNNLILVRGQETPENHPFIVLRGFFCRLVSFLRQKSCGKINLTLF
jgi:hypothetical protein